MAEKAKAKVKAKGNKRAGKLLSGFVVLAIVLSVLAASVATVSAVGQAPEPEVTGITVTADPTSIPMEVGTSTITATVTWVNKTLGDGFWIHFEILPPDLDADIGPEEYVQTNTSGVATATLAAGLTEGMVTVKASWVGDPGIYNTTTVTITEAPVTYYNLAVSSTDGGNVTDPSEGAHQYPAGTVVNLKAKADAGYRFVNWTGDVGTIANVNVNETTITMNGNYTITANFSAIGVDLKVEGKKYAEKTTAPGVNATYLLTVTNTGTSADTYTLSVENPDGAGTAVLNRTTITNLAPGAAADVLLNVGDATQGEYVVNVTATGTDVSDKVTTKTVVTEVIPFTRDLLEGWNMVGVPLNVSDWTLPTVLSSIAGNYDYVYYYNATTGAMDYYIAAHPEASTLTELEPLAGYLIDVSVADTLQFEGMKFTAPSRDLESGWNMFSVPYGVADVTLPTVLSSIEGKYDYVYYYNATTGGMDYYVAAHPEVSTLTELEPGAGYLINMTGADTFIPSL